jgi:hypothetical protein
MTRQQIEAVHAWYVRNTGLCYPLNAMVQRAWGELLGQYSEEDVKLVVKLLVRGVKDGERNQGALKLNYANFFDPDKFLDDLVLARKVFRRNPAPTLADQTRTVDSGAGVVTRIDPTQKPDHSTTAQAVMPNLLRDVASAIENGRKSS